MMSDTEKKNGHHFQGDRRMNRRDEEEKDGWASDSGSSSGSYYSNSSSSNAAWESKITSTGQVFYIESYPETINDKKQVAQQSTSPLPEMARRRSTRAGKLIRLLKRRESHRSSIRNKKTGCDVSEPGDGKKQEITMFDESQDGEVIIVNLSIDPEKRHKLGRRATLCEVYLGIVPRIAQDKQRILVAGFIPDGEAIKCNDIKVGDWLRSVNTKDVTVNNLDRVLAGISGATHVTLKLYRAAGTTSNNSPETVSHQTPLVRQLIDKEESQVLMESLIKEPLGVIFLKTSGLTETGSDTQGIVYSFPKSKSRNTQCILSLTRGAFITLNHLLPEIIGPRPVGTTIRTSSGLTRVTYFSCDEDLLLIALPEKCCNEYEASELSKDIVRALVFTEKNLTNCFSREDFHPSLDHFFYLFFSRLINERCSMNFGSEQEIGEKGDGKDIRICSFDKVLPALHYIQLPRDAQIQIDAALSEMEAMDYRDWNEDPMDCQRLFTIIGSCLYYKRYLVSSHLSHEDLVQIHSFLRRNNLIDLVCSEPVKSLVVWRRVYPMSCVSIKYESQVENQHLLPSEQWFLLVVGSGHNLLAVILECGGCTVVPDENTGPDVFYVEEAQETLKHIRRIGIPNLAEKWISSNAKPEVIELEERSASLKTSSITDNLLGFIKSDMQMSYSKSTSNLLSISRNSETSSSGTRRRSPEENPPTYGSAYSLQTSEDSMSQRSGPISEVSDEIGPVLGRRATRERAKLLTRQSDDTDSDFENDGPDAQDIADIRENLLNQAESIENKIITTGGKNCLLHYVQLDLLEGVLLSSNFDGVSPKSSKLLNNFNECAHVIHRLLSNTVRFKRMLNDDAAKTVINKSLIAIKEHGVLFEWEDTAYWVIGRLYTLPRIKELYVCYEDSAPQNLIEMAFRLQSMGSYR